MIIKKLCCLSLCLVYLSACSMPGGTIPSDHYYRLPMIEVESVTNQAQAIQIKPVRVDGLYHERSILYVDQNEPLEIKRYSYHYWVETPASLVQKYFNAYFIKAGLISDQSQISTATIELFPTLLNFERLISNGKAEAHVKIHIEMQSIAKSARLFSKTYESRVPASSMSMHDTVSSFGQALDEIAKGLVSDMQNAQSIQ